MTEVDKDAKTAASDDGIAPQIRMSRRAFVKGAAISTMGTVLLDGLSGPAHAEDLSAEMRVLGPGPVPLPLSVNG
jgi:hypothetical protein